MKKYIGEVTYEVCEGLANGLDDFKAASMISMEAMFTRYMGEGNGALSGFFTQMYGNTFWSLIQGCYEYHVHHRENRQHRMEEERPQVNTQALIDELSALNTEEEVASLQTQPFSEAYKKGSINKK